jgi:hypothetical protein
MGDVPFGGIFAAVFFLGGFRAIGLPAPFVYCAVSETALSPVLKP